MSHKYRTTKDHIFAWALIQQGEQLIYFPDGKLEYMNFTGKLRSLPGDKSKEEFVAEGKKYNIEYLIPDAWIKINSKHDYPCHLNYKTILVSDGQVVLQGYYDKDNNEFCGEEAIPYPKGWVKYWRVMPMAPGRTQIK